MITADATTLGALTRSFQLYVRAESWLGGVLLADDIPIDGGGEEAQGAAKVPERVTLTVPRRKDSVDWSPVEGSPLAADGQRLRIEIGISIGEGQKTWLQRGWFVITKSELSGDVVNVEAASLLWLIDEAKLVNPLQPTGTLLSTVRALLEPTLSVRDTGLSDRAVPSGINFDDDRLGALYELLDAWPARGRVTEDGDFLLSPDVQPAAGVLSLVHGAGGTVVEVNGSSSRANGFTLVVARGQDTAGNAVQGVAYQDSGPRAYGGVFNPQPVPSFFFSPLLTTNDQARSAAQTVLARRRRESGAEYTAEIVPNPLLQLGDPVTVTKRSAGLSAVLCTIEAYSLPYVPGQAGTMRLTLRRVR